MAGSAQIGALRVALGLDSAQFTSGLKSAQSSLGRFGKLASAGMAALAGAATGAAGALGLAVKGAINHADALNKSAQKAGLTVEALSRLEFAAKLSDVSLEGLTGGLQKLSKGMADAAQNAHGNTATAFQAIGISVTDASGHLRDSGAVFADVSDRFAHMENGATKTALAMAIFGKSGADLIPLLNSGKQALADMAHESDRLGATISTKTAGAAEKFNDTLTRIQTGMTGVVDRIIGETGLLDVLQRLADKLASPAYANGLVAFAGEFVKFADTSIREIERIGAALDYLQNNLNLNPLPSAVGAGEDALIRKLGLTRSPFSVSGNGSAGGGSGSASGSATLTGTYKPLAPVFTDQAAAAKAAADALKASDDQIKAMNADLASQQQAWEELQQPIRDTVAAVGDSLSGALSGVISDLRQGKDAVGGLIDAFGSLGDKLIQMALDQAIQGLLGSLLGAFTGGSGLGVGKGLTGAATYGGGGNGFYGIPSFAGGGDTGFGARSGGLDGKGGFMAVLHPDETVLDHTKGQGAGPAMTFNITGSRQDAAEIAKIARNEAMGVLRQWQRNPDR